MLCLCHYGPALLRFWFQTNLGRENSASYLEIQAGKTFSCQGHALVTLYVQFLCSDWSKFDRWVHAENLCSILKLVYFDSWSWQSFVSTCDVFNCLFPLDVQNEIQLLSRVFCYSWLVGLLVFWLRDASLVKVGNPFLDGIILVFHLAWKVWSNTAICGKTTQDATTGLILSLLDIPLRSQPVSKLYLWISVTPKEVREHITTSQRASTRATISQQQRRWRRPCYPTEEWKVSELLSCLQ